MIYITLFLQSYLTEGIRYKNATVAQLVRIYLKVCAESLQHFCIDSFASHKLNDFFLLRSFQLDHRAILGYTKIIPLKNKTCLEFYPGMFLLKDDNLGSTDALQ